MLNITNHQQIANQNHHEIPPHTCQDAIIIFLKASIGEAVEKLEPLCIVGGKARCTTVMKNSVELPQKVQNRMTT